MYVLSLILIGAGSFGTSAAIFGALWVAKFGWVPRNVPAPHDSELVHA
jgi:hypothetical protein